MIQRLIIAFTLIILRGLPLLQFTILIVISMYRIKILIQYSPFKESKDNAVELFNEYTILLVICLIHSMLIGNLSKDEKSILGWALIIGSSINIVGNMMIVIYFSSKDIGQASKQSIEKSKHKKDVEKRLFNDLMILPGVPMS